MTLTQRRAALEKARFYAILDTGYVAPDRLVAVAEQIVHGGVDLLQFRAKGWMRSEIVRVGQELREIIPAIDAATPGPLFILNDHPGLVEEIGADGVPVNVVVVRGLGLGLDEKAVEAITQWRFKPATLAGEPVAVSAQVEINFRLM